MTRHRPIFLLVLLLMTASPQAAIAVEDPVAELCDGQRETLRTGEIVYLSLEPRGGSGVAMRACGLIDAPPGQVWPVLRDCGDYQEFLPGVERSELVSREEGVAVCDTFIDLPFPLSGLHSVTRVRERELGEGGGFERQWTLLRGSYQRNEGSWRLLPWSADGSRTLAVYELDMDPETIVPDFLLRRAQASTVPRVFEAIRKRVRETDSSSSSS